MRLPGPRPASGRGGVRAFPPNPLDSSAAGDALRTAAKYGGASGVRFGSMLKLFRNKRHDRQLISASRYLGPIRQQVRMSRQSAPPPPWRTSGVFASPGLEAIGFHRNAELLLVVSQEGRGVIDCVSGEKVARKHDDASDRRPPHQLQALGIGPLEGETIAMCGRHGGGLPRVTHDGWSLEVVTLEWPTQDLLLVPPGASLFTVQDDEPGRFTRIESDPELQAYGFSYTGRSLVIATVSELVIYCRD